jgi:hypothetical protein
MNFMNKMPNTYKMRLFFGIFTMNLIKGYDESDSNKQRGFFHETVGMFNGCFHGYDARSL